MAKVFIDGGAGTTGLKISDRLKLRSDIELIALPEDKRKDELSRAEAMNDADIVFLCLPDDAAKEAVTLVENPKTVIIDTSTAHRTSDGWVYGFPEITGQRENIKNSKRIANPGCHASGFIALVAPLIENNILNKDTSLSCFSLTGYSGGGKKMIAEYEQESRSNLLDAPRMYGLSQTHKHLPEMKTVCGLKNEPAFCPVVADYYSGMEVVVPLFNMDIEEIKNVYKSYYGSKEDAEKNSGSDTGETNTGGSFASSGIIHYADNPDEDGFMSAAAFSGKDIMQISVSGNNERIILTSRFDNLGKGASGAAIQNMNIVLGIPDNTGLVL